MPSTFDFSGTLTKENEEDEARYYSLTGELKLYVSACSAVLEADTPEEAIEIVDKIQRMLREIGKRRRLDKKDGMPYTFNDRLMPDIEEARNNGGVIVISFMPFDAISPFIREHIKYNYEIYGGLTPKEKMNYVKGNVYLDDVCSFSMAYAAHKSGYKVFVIKNGSAFNGLLIKLLERFKIEYELK